MPKTLKDDCFFQSLCPCALDNSSLSIEVLPTHQQLERKTNRIFFKDNVSYIVGGECFTSNGFRIFDNYPFISTYIHVAV